MNESRYFRRDTLAFRFSDGVIRIEDCLERTRDTSTQDTVSSSGPGGCGTPDLTRLPEREVLEQEEVHVLFR